MFDLTQLLEKFIFAPEDPEINLRLALHYDNIGQTASAISYYLRCAERAEKKIEQYQCLLRAAFCFERQGCRNFTVRGLLQHAVSIMPDRPEGYYFLSRFLEREQNYHDGYLIASIGDQVAYEDLPPLSIPTEYPGFWGLQYEKAVCSWWTGLCDDSRRMFEDLLDNHPIDDIHRDSIVSNLKMLNSKNQNLHEVYHKSRKYSDFDWGIMKRNSWNYESLRQEFEKENYQKHFEVEKGDIVVDIGASVGPFSYAALDKKPSRVICLEPHPELYKTLEKNVGKNKKVTTLNSGISAEDGEVIFDGLYNDDLSTSYMGDDLWKKQSAGKGITFKTLIKNFELDKIDFLKIDCEGGEYDVFTEENYQWIKTRVKKIAGEFHFGTPELKQKFKTFRDKFLKKFSDYNVYFVDYNSNFNDVTDEVWNDDFIERNGWLNIYINNRPAWKNSIAPTMEFTTSIDVKNGCVVDCVFCPQRTLQKVYKGERFLSLDNFKKCVDKLPQEVRVTFAGFTEPWLNPKTTDMLLYADKEGHPISVFTTGIGMSLDDVDRIKDIQYAGNPNGGFVLHLPDQERKAKHPITKRYIEVIERFGEVHKDIHNFTLMCMGTVHEDVRHVFPEAPTYQMWSRAGNLLGESIMKPELLNRKDEYKSVYHGDQEMTCGCLEKLYHNITLPNGDVSLCCMDYGLEHILGNLLEQEYEEIMPANNTCYNLCRFCENAVKP